MNISIFGLGYVGCVGMGCLAAKGHNVVGVDVSEEKIRLINDGKPTIVEKDIDVLIENAHRQGMAKATNDYVSAVMETDISFLCVGTPSAPNGHLNLDYIMQTAREIGEALRRKNTFHVVVIRSTVFPGTNAKVSSLIEELSGKKRNVDFAVVSNPEFLREGTAVKDYLNPPLTVLGSESEEAIGILKRLYETSGAPIEVVDIKVAEMIKYVNNSYHALKVVFGNEIGRICKALNIDSHEVMRLFCMDRQLNISPYYFMPGFAYGGSCLPKDLKGLKTLAHDLYLDTPVLNAIDESNQVHLQSVISYIENAGKRKIGVLGLSFKSGTDDMRNSPVVNVIEHFHGKGYEIRIYDRNVSISRLMGKNKSIIAEKLPHLNVMLQDNLEDVTNWAELLVISNKDEAFKTIQPKNGQLVYDLARVSGIENYEGYNGLCW
ncbi:MAG: nucleotide sugar dehydrogenase [Bacteroidales bacterium]|nr:nucleotide sugar dehydrogenase [Bacteroidales bacterium]